VTRCIFLKRQTARATPGLVTAARNGYLTEVQATTETARVSERVARSAKFLHHTTHRDPLQLSSSPDSARHARFGYGGAKRCRTRKKFAEMSIAARLSACRVCRAQSYAFRSRRQS